MSTIVRNDAGGLTVSDTDLVDLSATTDGASGAKLVGIYGTQDFVPYFPSEVTDVQAALFNCKASALQANQFAQAAIQSLIKKDANFTDVFAVVGQPAPSVIIESNQGTPLIYNAKLVGVAVRIPQAWLNVENSSIVANIGFIGQLDSLAANINLTAANPNAGTSTPFPVTGPMNWVMNSVGSLIPTIQIVSANDLTSMLTGQIGVDLYYVAI